jgi:hypothetical protein
VEFWAKYARAKCGFCKKPFTLRKWLLEKSSEVFCKKRCRELNREKVNKMYGGSK